MKSEEEEKKELCQRCKKAPCQSLPYGKLKYCKECQLATTNTIPDQEVNATTEDHKAWCDDCRLERAFDIADLGEDDTKCKKCGKTLLVPDLMPGAKFVDYSEIPMWVCITILCCLVILGVIFVGNVVGWW